EQRELRDLVRQLARERIAPRAAEIDESHEFPWDVVELFRENDLFGLFFDEEHGGLGTGTLLSLVAVEEVSKVCATSGLILAVQAGISAFVVEADTPGFEVARVEAKMGIRGSTTGELVFEDCRVPAENLLGAEGEGFKIAMRILDRSRPGVAAQGLGIAQGATDYALEYAKTRETMGKPIGQHQLVAAMLADMETKCEAARGLLYRFGAAVDEG